MSWGQYKVDANQAEIVDALRRAGCSVQVLAAVGHGCPDLLVGRAGRQYLLEVKNLSGRGKRLTPDQLAWIAAWRGSVAVVTSISEAFAAVGLRMGDSAA